MNAAKDVFKTWYTANYDEQEGEDDIKALFKEAFEAGMVSGIVFVQSNFLNLVENLIDDYEGFQNEND